MDINDPDFEHNLLASLGEPVSGKTYFADGWKYRNIPSRIILPYWHRLLEALGKDNYVLLSEAKYIERDGTPTARGQMLISPQGFVNLGKLQEEFAAEAEAEKTRH